MRENSRNPAESGPFGMDVTLFLRRLSQGDIAVVSRVMSAVYTDLKRIAAERLRRERPDHTLEPAALVSEFFIHFLKMPGVEWKSRQHFLAVASHEMRRLLIDYARSRSALRRGGSGRLVEWNDAIDPLDEDLESLLQVNELLDRLAVQDPRAANIVEMRCFGGMTYAEIADILGIHERTAKRDWQLARAWLEVELGKSNKRVPRTMATGEGRL